MNERPIRDRLLEQEERSPAFEEKFRKEMKKMMEKKLSLAEKIGWWLSTLLFGPFFVIFFGYLAITAPRDFPLWGRIIFILGPLFGVAEIGLGIWALRRGSSSLRHENATHGLAFVVLLEMLIISTIVGSQIEDKIKGVQMILTSASFFMIFGIPALFNLRINRTETALREHLLKLELKMAELADRMQQGK